ncbi:S1C family serine protease [Pedobacter sp. SL55]|uniref:S1C family serine protease n=1 Tax=Pedobacter sp. SL55 TaxID=2995161 RepID=UPI00226FFBFE|nr:trypsin-like peptidase domain-containing protein [Pedobacter sp. SL55]WAC39006.1 trypsin-like peptidase domain-containing protein [Pedobacter sp. SL55]
MMVKFILPKILWFTLGLKIVVQVHIKSTVKDFRLVMMGMASNGHAFFNFKLMNSMYKKLAMLLLGSILLSVNAYAQKKKLKQFEEVVAQAINRSYPASVRMWSFDVKQNQRTGAQFSGVVVTADGYILTAAHTTNPGTNYKVFFPDGKECIAIALGRIDNPKTPGMPDVGMMKITDKGVWPFAEMGFSHSLVAGEPCISIAYPESLDHKLPTLRLGKVAEVKNQYGFIRSTCKMEPGDSGGPLFDYHGRVIGLHSAIDVGEDQNFEIPVDLYRNYWTALQQEISYTDFPKQKDSIGKDPLAATIQKENQQRKLHPAFDTKAKKLNCMSITSTIQSKQQQILATLFNEVDKQGVKRQFLVTKLSMLGKNPMLNAFPQTKLALIAKDQENDLVILSVHGTNSLPDGINLSEVPLAAANMGKLIYCEKDQGELLAGVLGSELFSLPKISSRPYLGAMLKYNSKPALFSLINPESPAGTAGIKVGDELVAFNGQKIEKANDLVPALQKHWPGDEITLTWKSDTATITKTLILADVKKGVSSHPAERIEGGKSERRDGFKQVFAHDANVKAGDCGSPVFDLEGKFLGINIARFSRTTTVVLPASVVLQFVKQSI